MKRLRSGRKKQQLEITQRKTQPLTAEDLRAENLKRHVALALARAYRSSSTSNSRFSILDVGCGRGATVALLRQNGWDAFGAEIDPIQAELARVGMRAIGQDPQVILDIAPTGVICAADDRFDFLVSEQVLEHVENVETFVSETWRVLRPGGTAFHVFPSRWRFVEPHIRQPLVSWLPKGLAQSLAVHFWVALGVEAGSLRLEGASRIDLEGMSRNERATEYAGYLRERTHYRSQGIIESMFLEYFETLDMDVIGDTIAESRGFSTLATFRPLRRFLEEICVRFYSSALFVTKGTQR